MDTVEKLRLLGAAAHDEVCDDFTSMGLFAPAADQVCGGPDLLPHVARVLAPGGRAVPVLKILQTSACENNCLYCAFRAGRDLRRAHFTPDELARSFDLMQRAGVVQGMFLSSGIVGAPRTMDEMLATAELVRGKYGFRGYLHLKLLPGAQAAQIERAVALADRVSTNLEAPTPSRLAALAPQKQMEQLWGSLATAADIIRRAGAPWRSRANESGRTRLGMSTQFVVGPAGESDQELLASAQRLYRELGLARAYYSAFSPIAGTPLESAAPAAPRREFRLYQADFLLRRYGFAVEELTFEGDGDLSQRLDPKTAWAQAHPERFPIEVNRAACQELLRVPGIGPVAARAIVQARGRDRLTGLGDLKRLGARAEQAAPYVTLAGRRLPYQPPLPFPDTPG